MNRKVIHAGRVQTKKKSLSTGEASKDFTEEKEFGLNLEDGFDLKYQKRKASENFKTFDLDSISQ